MSWKSIIFSILTLVIGIAFLFVVAFMFAVHIILGIVGVILWCIINTILRNKALHNATGIVDTVLAKYIVPILAAIIIVGLILCLIIPGAFNGVFWFLTG